MNSFSHHAEFEDYATNKRDYAADQESRRVVAFTASHVKNYDNVVGVLCCYKAPAWAVVEQSHARQFARYSTLLQ